MAITLVTTTVGVGATALRMTIPGGFQVSGVSNVAFWNPIRIVDNGGTGTVGLASADTAFPTLVQFWHADTTATWTASTNLTSVVGQIDFPVS